VRGALEEVQLGGVDPRAGKVGIVVDTETVCEHNVLGAACLADVIVPWVVTKFVKVRGLELTLGRLAASKTMLPHTASAKEVSRSFQHGELTNRRH
jgi:hypothetical protein